MYVASPDAGSYACILQKDEMKETIDCYSVTVQRQRSYDNIYEMGYWTFYWTDWFEGYARKKQHALYTTTNADYGSRPPNVHTMQTVFFDRPQKFTNVSLLGLQRPYVFSGSTPSVVTKFFLQAVQYAYSCGQVKSFIEAQHWNSCEVRPTIKSQACRFTKHIIM